MKTDNLYLTLLEEIFNEHNLSHIEKYFGKDSVEGSPKARKGRRGFEHFLNDLMT